MTKTFEKFEKYVLGGSILLICVASLINVVCRSLMGFSLSFIEELNQYLIITITFVGTAYGVRVARHIRMSALFDILSLKNKRLFCLFIDLMCSLLFLYLAYLSVEYIIIVYKLGSTGAAIRVPKAIMYSIVPVGLLSSSFLYLQVFIKNLTSKDIYLGVERKLGE